MNETISQNPTATVSLPYLMVQKIFEEIKLLRKEVSFILPKDNLEKYAHPEKIRSSYEKALQDYPPVNC